MKKMVMRILIVTVLVGVAAVGVAWAQEEGIACWFDTKGYLSYKVYFNAVPTGTIVWKYGGTQSIEGKVADILLVESDTTIMKFLDIETKEKVFLDQATYLPLRVERDVELFGKKEVIVERYDQEKGEVTITRDSAPGKEEVLAQKPPIHHILALLYFFPKDTGLEEGKIVFFNLPTQKVKIKRHRDRVLKTREGKRNTMFLVGRGAKRFNLWLDKEEMIPLRLEFITLMGKLSIVKDKQ